MSARREERMPLRLAATVWGMQPDGTLFVDQVRTTDISSMGACLTGFTHPVHPGMLLSIQQGNSTGRFRVVWVGEPGTPREGQVGISCVEIGQALSKTVLVIENHDHEAEARRSTLSPAGFSVITRIGASAGIRELESSPIAAVLITHPLYDAALDELLAYIRSRHEQVRILILSSQPDKVPGHIRAFADGCLHKGAPRTRLVAAVEELIGPALQVKWPLTRVSHRFQVKTAAEIRLVRHGQVYNAIGQTSDISEDGMSLTTALEITPGELVTVRFALPTSPDVVEVRGAIRHRNQQQYGIEFVLISTAQQQAIRALCSVLPPVTNPIAR